MYMFHTFLWFGSGRFTHIFQCYFTGIDGNLSHDNTSAKEETLKNMGESYVNF